MNALTTKALSLAIVTAVWAMISHLGKINLQLWPVIVGLACFVGAGGGTVGLQKSILGTISGVVWAALYIAIAGALGRQNIVDALVLGAAVFGIVYQARVPLLSYTTAAIAGAATYLAMGFRTFAMNGALRVAIALAIGCVLGIAAGVAAGQIYGPQFFPQPPDGFSVQQMVFAGVLGGMGAAVGFAATSGAEERMKHSGTIVAIDTATHTALGYTPVGREPHLATVHPGGREAWVAVRGESHINVLKLDRDDLFDAQPFEREDRADDINDGVEGADLVERNVQRVAAVDRGLGHGEPFEGPEMTKACIDILGPDVLMHQSDYPHGECSFPDTAQQVIDWPIWKDLGRDALAKHMGGNAARFLRLI